MVFTFPKNSFLQCPYPGRIPFWETSEKPPEIAENIHALKGNGSGIASFSDIGLRALGNRLDQLFRLMTPAILDEASLSFIQGNVQGYLYEGIYHQGSRYCLIETFGVIDRLQAYCMAQRFAEQGLDYVITASSLRSAVWVEVDAYFDAYFKVQRCLL
ncbi:MAG: hypothetical protein AAGF01_04305 [Cyanobacteria bacterium P01_G01_bin.38]